MFDEQLSGAPDHQVLAAAVAEHRALVTMDLDFANPIRFPPADTAGIAVLRLREQTVAADIDRLVAQLVAALDTSDLAGHLWIVEQHRVRQYTEPTDW